MFRKHLKIKLFNGEDNKIRQESSMQNTPVSLIQLANGTSAKISKLQGGRQIIGKLKAMGIMPGTVIVKKSASMMKGPVVIEIGATQLAIGYGMAGKIFAEPLSS